MPGMEEYGSALLITFGFLAVSVTVVAFLMWWLFKFFKNKD